MSTLKRIGLGVVLTLLFVAPPAGAWCERQLECPELWSWDPSICGCRCTTCECRVYYGECWFGSQCCEECFAPGCFLGAATLTPELEPKAPVCSAEPAAALPF